MYATMVVGDLPGAIDRAADLARQINPGVSGQAIRGQIGMFLGDDGMNSIPAGSGLMMAVPYEGRPFFVLETADGKADKIAAVFERRGKMAVTTSGGNLVIGAKDQASLDAVLDGETSAAAEMLAKSNDKFMLMTLDADKLANDKGDKLRSGLDEIARKAAEKGKHSTTATATLLKIFGNFVVAVGKRTDVATVKVDVSGDGVMFDRAVYPKGGVHLDAATGPSGQDLRKALIQPGPTVASFDYHLDSQSALKAIKPVFAETISGIGLSPADVAEISSLFDMAAQGYGDAFTGWASPGKDGTAGAYILTLENGDAALNEIKTEIDSLKSGALSRYFALLGLETSATLKQNAGDISGKPVHEFSVAMKPEGGKGAALMSKIYDVRSGKFIVVDDKMLLTLGDASLDKLAAAMMNNLGGGGAAVESRSKMDDGGFVYIDLHPGALAESGFVTNPMAKKMLQAIGGSAIYQAGYVDQEKIRFNALVPADMVKKLAAAAQELKNSVRDSQSAE
jgi:hypothetical protein